jgi:hypothetical protein
MAVKTSGKTSAMGGFAVKKRVRALLASPDFEIDLETSAMPPTKIINPLLCFLVEIDERTRWRAIRGVGITVSTIAATDIEPAREIMRRLIWSLNDESGGIGWGAPEAMGEIMAENEQLAVEYHRILVSYIDEHGNPLENDLLERGVLWGIARLAQKRPRLLQEWIDPIAAQLNSRDPVKRALALKALLWVAKSCVKLPEPRARLAPLIRPLLNDPSEFRTFQDGSFVCGSIAGLAGELLSLLDFSGATAGDHGAMPRENP